LNASPPSEAEAAAPAPQSLSVREIKEELKSLGASFADCFDKESLVLRLAEARESKSSPESSSSNEQETATAVESTQEAAPKATNEPEAPPSSSASKEKSQDDKSMLEEIRSMRVRELREELAKRNLRWGGLLEKEDLVQAVFQARKKAADFSVTGLIAPGDVGELTGEQLEQELSAEPGSKAPLLLDAYAVWCGPCQMMAPQLLEASKVWGDRVRVAKMDTDQHPAQAAKFKVQGLPTLILFDSDGNIMDRMEGALMKDQLVQWVESKL